MQASQIRLPGPGVILAVLALLVASLGAWTVHSGDGGAAGTAADSPGPLQRAGYRVYGGDVNGDGRADILLRAPPRLFVTELGNPEIPLQLPLQLRARAPSLALLSRVGGYTLELEPGRALRTHPAWRPGGYELLFGDVLGDGSEVILVRALEAGGIALTVAGAGGGAPFRVLQVLTPDVLRTDLGHPEATVSFESRNDDSRADLVVRRPGAPPRVFLAQADGRFGISPEGELLSAWVGFCDALLAADVNGALDYLDDSVDDKYREAFAALGAHLKEIPRHLSAPALVDLAPDHAQFVLTDTSTGAPLLHFISFIRQGDRWLLASL